MTREEVLKHPAYWFEHEQNELFRQVSDYMEREHINQTELANKLKVSKGYVSQILNGNFNYTLKKLIELSLAIGIVPQITYTPIDIVISDDKEQKKQFSTNSYPMLSNKFSEWAEKHRFPVEHVEQVIGKNDKQCYGTFTKHDNNILKNSKSNSTLIAA